MVGISGGYWALGVVLARMHPKVSRQYQRHTRPKPRRLCGGSVTCHVLQLTHCPGNMVPNPSGTGTFWPPRFEWKVVQVPNKMISMIWKRMHTTVSTFTEKQDLGACACTTVAPAGGAECAPGCIGDLAGSSITVAMPSGLRKLASITRGTRSRLQTDARAHSLPALQYYGNWNAQVQTQGTLAQLWLVLISRSHLFKRAVVWKLPVTYILRLTQALACTLVHLHYFVSLDKLSRNSTYIFVVLAVFR